jgi:hypothetical protein
VRGLEPEDGGLIAITADLSRDGCFVRIKTKGGERRSELEIAGVEEFYL